MGKSRSVQLLVNRKDANAFQQHQTCKVRDKVDEYFTVSPPDAYLTHLCHYDSTLLQYICLCLQLRRSGAFPKKLRYEDQTSNLVFFDWLTERGSRPGHPSSYLIILMIIIITITTIATKRVAYGKYCLIKQN